MSIKLRDVLDVVCTRTGVEREALRSTSRERHVSEARGLVYYLARRHTRLSWRSIARFATGADGSTARHRAAEMHRRLALDEQLASDVGELEQELRALADGTNS